MTVTLEVSTEVLRRIAADIAAARCILQSVGDIAASHEATPHLELAEATLARLLEYSEEPDTTGHQR